MHYLKKLVDSYDSVDKQESVINKLQKTISPNISLCFTTNPNAFRVHVLGLEDRMEYNFRNDVENLVVNASLVSHSNKGFKSVFPEKKNNTLYDAICSGNGEMYAQIIEAINPDSLFPKTIRNNGVYSDVPYDALDPRLLASSNYKK